MSPSGHFTYIHATKPWKTQGPVYRIHTADPQSNIDKCLECRVTDDCHPESKRCPLKGGVNKHDN